LVAIFGPTNAAAWGPAGPQQVVLQAPVPCGPCAYVGHQVGLRNGCAAKTCLKLVTPDMVIAAARRLLVGEDYTPPPARRRRRTPPRAPAATILGVRVDAVTFAGALERIESFIAAKQPHQIVTVNPEFVVAAQSDAVFRRILNRAALAVADGAGLLKAAAWLSQPPLPERIAGVDMVEALAALAAQKGYRIFFLGAQPGVAEKAVAVLQARYPGMASAGAFAGSPRAADEAAIVAKIQAARPDIVLVAYGAPEQDKWIARNMHRLPASVLMGVGGAFDFISGAARRAPRRLQRRNLEWLHRFIRQPWRWRRMWNAVPRFLWLVFWARRKTG
ncbi:MAG: WecB/TagA/CpsF family glycosyltransferase, partial [Anaerolineae bacterium]